MSRPLVLLAAVDDEGGIGRGGALPWRLRADMAFFRDRTTGPGGGHNAVVLGRRTWESLPERFRPLPERVNVVVSRDPAFTAPGALVARSFDEAVQLAEEHAPGETFVVGGAAVYEAALEHPDCGPVLLTRIRGSFDCDVRFPRLDELVLVAEGPERTEGDLRFRFCEYAPPRA